MCHCDRDNLKATDHHRLGVGPGPEVALEWRAAGRGICFLRLSPSISGLARRGLRGGEQLDGEFALYASESRRRLRQLRAWPGGGGGGARSWTENFERLSSPTLELARRARVGRALRAAGRGICFLRLSPPTSGLAQRGRGRGALPWRGVCLSIFH